ncbi:MAG: lecithin retinol acyltransferase family protein [Thiomargarita sp.]|nr:lecithin retinol acyltransferase family protein [Thiomargarita sp.]
MNIPIGSAIQRRLAGIEGVLYKHVGIYIGDEKVIHFYGEGKKDKKAKVIETTLSDFGNEEEIRIKKKPQNANHAKAVCDEAKSICSDSKNEYNGKYSAILKNCEDFVKHCYEVEY